jgi:hypothetical protein
MEGVVTSDELFVEWASEIYMNIIHRTGILDKRDRYSYTVMCSCKIGWNTMQFWGHIL